MSANITYKPATAVLKRSEIAALRKRRKLFIKEANKYLVKLMQAPLDSQLQLMLFVSEPGDKRSELGLVLKPWPPGPPGLVVKLSSKLRR